PTREHRVGDQAGRWEVDVGRHEAGSATTARAPGFPPQKGPADPPGWPATVVRASRRRRRTVARTPADRRRTDLTHLKWCHVTGHKGDECGLAPPTRSPVRHPGARKPVPWGS